MAQRSGAIRDVLVKVDRVRSVEEFQLLAEAGADVICCALGRDARFVDDRCLDLAATIQLSKSVRNSLLCLDLSDLQDDLARRSIIDGLKPPFVQFSATALPSKELRQWLHKRAIRIFYRGLQLDYDDDPSWLFSRIEDEVFLNEACFQVDVFPTVADSWKLLSSQVNRFDGEIHLKEVRELVAQRPALLCLNYTVSNVLPSLQMLTELEGIAIVLADGTRDKTMNVHSLESALQVCRLVRGTYSQ